MIGNTRPHRVRVIKLANKHQTCTTVRQDLLNGLDGQSGVQGHRNMASHPDSPIGHDPVGCIFSPNGDATARRIAQRLQMACHATHFMRDFSPRECLDHALPYRLRETNAVGGGRLPVVKPLQGQHVGRGTHVVCLQLLKNQQVVSSLHSTWQTQSHHFLPPRTLE